MTPFKPDWNTEAVLVEEMQRMSKEAMKLALEALENNKPTHYYCEDTWYSCPKHEEGCANEAEGNECNCGADEINAQVDEVITALREALAEQPAQQEPVATVTSETGADISMSWWHEPALPIGTQLYASLPAQRTWVGLTDEEIYSVLENLQVMYNRPPTTDSRIIFARAIEQRLKEKNA